MELPPRSIPAGLEPQLAAWLGAGAASGLAVVEVSGGLFNRVYRVDAPGRTYYYKQFSDRAKLGEFPPLPTSPWQRWWVASLCHAHAARCATGEEVRVPAIVHSDEAQRAVVMEASPGALLYHDVIVGGATHAVRRAAERVVVWLARLHATPLPELATLVQHSAAFRRYKVDLQYHRLLPELGAAGAAGARFVEQFLATERHVLHGDLNSRNILVDGDRVAIIDFEQGQVGDGVYDVAYLVSELAIACLRAGGDPAPMVDALWALYVRHGDPADDTAARDRALRVHLAFQVLYRLVGPSRAIWTGHLDGDAKAAVRGWALREAMRWLR